jgi:hypothetical protein
MLPIALVAAALAAAGGDVTRHRLRLVERDYFLPPPAQRSLLLLLDARAAAPKTRIMFTAPLPPGRHRFRIEVTGGRGKTFVVAVPAGRGRSRYDVDIAGAGRFDFGFWSDAGAGAGAAIERRFTVEAPVKRTFELEMPDP